MKGIILACSTGTQLDPITRAVGRHLLPIYDKPLIYYPLSTLMLLGIRDILIISNPQEVSQMSRLLGTGADYGIKLDYASYPETKGMAKALTIARDFLGDSSLALIMGDNIFYGQGLSELLMKSIEINSGATIFGYVVSDTTSYSVVEFDRNRRVKRLEEDARLSSSNHAITGLYLYDNQVLDIADTLTQGDSGAEIFDINCMYMENTELSLEVLGRGVAWLDMTTHESMLRASNFVKAIEKRQGLKIACIEEVAYRMGYITAENMKDIALPLLVNEYGLYLTQVLESAQANRPTKNVE